MPLLDDWSCEKSNTADRQTGEPEMIHDGSIGAAFNSILSAFPGFARKSVYPRFTLSRYVPATATNVATNVRKQIVIRRKFLAIAIGWTP
jgi:hypothetical protein